MFCPRDEILAQNQKQNCNKNFRYFHFLDDFNFESVSVYVCLYLNSYVPVKSPLILKDYFYAKYSVSASADFIPSSRALYLILVKCFQKK